MNLKETKPRSASISWKSPRSNVCVGSPGFWSSCILSDIPLVGLNILETGIFDLNKTLVLFLLPKIMWWKVKHFLFAVFQGSDTATWTYSTTFPLFFVVASSSHKALGHWSFSLLVSPPLNSSWLVGTAEIFKFCLLSSCPRHLKPTCIQVYVI